MKKAILLSCVLLLSGCGYFDRLAAHYTGYALICVQNVSYIQFTSGAAPLYTADGKLVPCK